MERELLTFTLGACLGSFANLVAWRSAHGIANMMDRSRCIGCASLLRWYEMIPLVGYFICQGRCPRCRCLIPRSFPAIEAASGVVLVALVRPGIPAHAALWTAFLLGFLILTAEADRISMRIPNGAVGVGMAFGVGHEVFFGLDGLWVRLGYAALAGMSIWGVRQLGWLAFGQPGMGIGDIKLALALGILIGRPVFPILYVAFMLAGLVAMAGLASKHLEPGQSLPFAPYVSSCALAWLLVSDGAAGMVP